MNFESHDLMKNFTGNSQPLLMGILNVTPDSFYDGGNHNSVHRAVERGVEMTKQGADLIDVGGESTRPGADPVSAAEEIDRVCPVIKRLRKTESPPYISVDTSKAQVAEKALDAGADCINDVYALRNDSELIQLVAKRDTPIILMHMQGTPQTMQNNPSYENVIDEICNFFDERTNICIKNGISESQIVLDPGIGFGKTLAHNRIILKNVERFANHGFPLLLGHSRKSFLGDVLGTEVEDRLTGTLGVSANLMDQSVDLLRVHDVREHDQLRRIKNWLDSPTDSNG